MNAGLQRPAPVPVVPPKPSRTSLVGPLAGWELVRLARRGQSHRARLLLLYILALTFVGFALYWFTFSHRRVAALDLFFGNPGKIDPADAARFADDFALWLLLAQLLVVTAITPAYAAATVAEEKDRKTLLLLLTTALTDREIVFGKAAGRAGFVLAAVLAGTPVLMIAALFGGIDFVFLGCGYLLVATTAALTTALGVYAACGSPDLRSAVLRAYGLTLAFVCGMIIPPCSALSPFGVLLLSRDWSGPGMVAACVTYAAVQAAAAVMLLTEAARVLRTEDQLPPLKSDFPLPPKPAAEPVRRGPPVVFVLPKFDPKRPVLWKERCGLVSRSGGRDAAVVVVGLLAVLLMGLGVMTLLERGAKLRDSDPGGQLLVSGAVFAAGAYLVPLALGVAGMIARERERQTLDSLLSIPLGRREILVAKLRAHVRPAWPLAVAAVVAIGVGFAADGSWLLGVTAAAAELAGFGLVVGLGTWLTVRCPGELRAFRLLLPAVVIVVGLPVATWNGMDWARPERWAWRFGSAAVVFGLAGLLLWRRAVRELEQGE